MYMHLKSDIAKKLRTDRGWSQQQLADICSVNLRTIQRLENTNKCSLETLNALLSAFDVKRSVLESETRPAPKAKIQASWFSTLNIEKVSYYISTVAIGFYLLIHLALYAEINSLATSQNFVVRWLGMSIGAQETLASAEGHVVMPTILMMFIFTLSFLFIGMLRKQPWITLACVIVLPVLYVMSNISQATFTPVTMIVAAAIGYVLFYAHQYSKSSRQLVNQ
ncbi:MAG: helix-turn-helix domain-containing protein [Kangiellaceae bacterium]|nr:helix-turn-helix domain-containing protein [Kangiellaceae bacterium]MCW8997932.1 helix-turn-helix domain-containing protein [Kangiellaceae bacterium]